MRHWMNRASVLLLGPQFGTAKSISINQVRTLNAVVANSFKASDVRIERLPPEKLAAKPDWNKLIFGAHINDHMLEIYWNKQTGWAEPKICPVHNLSFHPYAKVLHYATELFEGMKAFRSKSGQILLFRPDMNMARMRRSADRLCFPDFDGAECTELIKELLRVDASWVPPYETRASMYIRPTMIGIDATLGVSPCEEVLLFVVAGPVGPYFGTGALKPVSLLADPKYVRAWPGGSGDRKLGSNYAPTLAVQREANKQGYQQVLWLYGAERELTEVGTMNIFVLVKREDGQPELWTPPLHDGLILPGVTRYSLIDMIRSWNEIELVERKITMGEIIELNSQGRVLEMFGAGTACVVCPVGEIAYEGQLLRFPEPKFALRLYDELTAIQYGDKPHPWAVAI